MKKKLQQTGAVIVVLLAILIASAGKNPGPESKRAVKTITVTASGASDEECKQCGVTSAQVIEYLQNCSHHHTVSWVSDIPGTCNSSAGIENCGTATVYVSGGSIIGHQDQAGYCGDSPSMGGPGE